MCTSWRKSVQFYWRKSVYFILPFTRNYPAYFADAETLLEQKEHTSGYDVISSYLGRKPSDLCEYLQTFLPATLNEQFEINNFGWTDKLVGEEGVLTRAKVNYEYETGILQEAMKKIVEGGSGSYDHLNRRLNNYRREGAIPFLSKNNVLPKYGFPVDTVELSVYDNKGSGRLNLDLSRDLSMAISEYAPESQVIADGNLITSQYIKRPPSMGWKLYDYCYCACKTLNIEPHVDQQDMPPFTSCKVCGQSLSDYPSGVFIVPDFGFEAGKIEKAKLIKPKRTHNSEVAYVGYKTSVDFQKYINNNRNYSVAFSQGDEMAVINRSNFFVCSTCGYAHLDEKAFKTIIEREHNFSNGGKCPNKYLKKYSLGYRFDTDVIQIQFCWPQITRFEQALSVLYGIMRGVCFSLNIEESDIAGTIQYFHNEVTNTGSYSIVLFDKTPGGAGHVKRLYDETAFMDVMKTTLQLMRSCDCGGEKKDTSCYNCLRSYSNQKYHDQLERRYVIDFLEKFFDEHLEEPVVFTVVDHPDDLESTLRRLLVQYGLTIYDTRRFRNQLKNKLTRFHNLGDAVIAVYDAEIIDTIWNNDKLDQELIDFFVRSVSTSTSIGAASIKMAVELWIQIYGRELLGKYL